MTDYWERLGCSMKDSELMDSYDGSDQFGERAEMVYIDMHRIAYYMEFFAYLRENDVDIFSFLPESC